MDLKRLFTDDDAVSPVIGVILMVAITVILAAVIASLVLGLGDEPQTTPSAQFSFDYDAHSGNSTGVLTVSHNGGESLDPGEIEFRGSAEDNWGTEGNAYDSHSWEDQTWESASGSSDEISTGSSVELAVNDQYDVTVTYVPSEGGDTAPLASDDGPEA